MQLPPEELTQDRDAPDVLIPSVDHPWLDREGPAEDEANEGQVPKSSSIAHDHSGLRLHEAGRATALTIQAVVRAEPATLLAALLYPQVITDSLEPVQDLGLGGHWSAGVDQRAVDLLATNQLGRPPVGIVRPSPPSEVGRTTGHSGEQTDTALIGNPLDEIESRHLFHPKDPLDPLRRLHGLHKGRVPSESRHTSCLAADSLQSGEYLVQHLWSGIVRRGQRPYSRKGGDPALSEGVESPIPVSVAHLLELFPQTADGNHHQQPRETLPQLGELPAPRRAEGALGDHADRTRVARFSEIAELLDGVTPL